MMAFTEELHGVPEGGGFPSKKDVEMSMVKSVWKVRIWIYC
jgi:hypothetical protein